MRAPGLFSFRLQNLGTSLLATHPTSGPHTEEEHPPYPNRKLECVEGQQSPSPRSRAAGIESAVATSAEVLAPPPCVEALR